MGDQAIFIENDFAKYAVRGATLSKIPHVQSSNDYTGKISRHIDVIIRKLDVNRIDC